MPVYTYEDLDTGEVLELYHPMSEAIPQGDETVRDGRRLRHLVERTHPAPFAEVNFVDFQARQWDPTAPRHVNRPGHHEHGFPLFLSRQELREHAAKNNHCREWNGPL